MKNNTMLNFLKIIKLSEEITFLKSQERPIVSELVQSLGYFDNRNSLEEIQECRTYKKLMDYLRMPFLSKYESNFETIKKDIISLWTYYEIPKVIAKRKTTINNLFWRISKDKHTVVTYHCCLNGFMFTAVYTGTPFVYISDTNNVVYGKFIEKMLKKWHNFS